MPERLDLDALYTVDGLPGVACRVRRYATEDVHKPNELVCDDDDCDHDTAACWVTGETSAIETEDFVIVVMVGDDKEHTVDVTDLTKIEPDVCSCGQVGCSWE
jgi:hypothetical protein